MPAVAKKRKPYLYWLGFSQSIWRLNRNDEMDMSTDDNDWEWAFDVTQVINRPPDASSDKVLMPSEVLAAIKKAKDGGK